MYLKTGWNNRFPWLLKRQAVWVTSRAFSTECMGQTKHAHAWRPACYLQTAATHTGVKQVSDRARVPHDLGAGGRGQGLTHGGWALVPLNPTQSRDRGQGHTRGWATTSTIPHPTQWIHLNNNESVLSSGFPEMISVTQKNPWARATGLVLRPWNQFLQQVQKQSPQWWLKRSLEDRTCDCVHPCSLPHARILHQTSS